MKRLAVVGAITLAVTLAACGGSNDANNEASAKNELIGLVRSPKLDVSEVSLPEVTNGLDEQPFRMRAANDRLLVVYFGYTRCPDICPTSLAALRRAYTEIREDADRMDTAMVTVDPARDTGEVLTEYLQNFFESNYHALRVEDETLLEAAEKPFLASSSVTLSATAHDDPHASGNEPIVTHTGTTYAVDENGIVVVEWPFGTEADTIANDLEILFDRMDKAT